MKRFRTKLLLLFIGLLLGKNMNAQVSASLDEFSIKPGETKEVNVYLTNGDIDITDFEGYIALPKGFSFVAAYDNNSYAKMTGRETAGQALTAEIQTDGRLLFGIYQMTGTTGFSGKEGSVVAFTIKADENINLGNYTLKMDDGLAVTIEAVSYDTPCSSTITVYKLFDVNVSSNNTTWGNVTGGGKELMPNTSVTLTATPVEGYKFVNWTFGETELSKENPYTFNVNDDTNIVGNFAINQYTMTFVPGNGEENIVKTQDYGTELTAPDNLKREGYTFNGWDSEVPQTVPASDKTFTAQWTSTVYTITYTLDGGKTETENPTNYTIESKEITLNNPAKEGYTFMGWTGTGLKQATSEVTIPQGSTGNRSYTATWKVNQYTMTFVPGNGEENIVKTQDYGTELTAPDNLKREGYAFNGWDSEVPQTVPASDKIFTAQWEAIKYQLTFKDGDKVIKQENLEMGATVTAPENPTKEGYTFTGWNPALATEMPANDLTYTATWKVNQYTMTFVHGNGEENIVKTQDYGTELTAPDNLKREGYAFNGWDSEVPQTVPASDKIFTAQWEAIKYQLTFKDGDKIIKQENLEMGATVTAPENPTKEGYTFTGWNPALATEMPANDLTYTATWKVNQYTMTFVPGNGEENIVKTQDYGTELTAPDNLQREGYTFNGWDSEVPQTVPASDKTFTAQWTSTVYTITYTLDGGKTETENPTSYTIESKEITLNNPAKEGYTFMGWTGTGLKQATSEVTIPQGSTGNRSYTATWKVNQYTMTFVPGNGEENIVKTQDYGTELTAPDNPQWAEHTFTGWSPRIPKTVPASDATFTAQWDIVKYQLTFKDGDKIIKQEDLEMGATVTAPENPTKEGYTFTGWNPALATEMPANDLTYTATWKVNQYTMTFVPGNGEENIVKTQDYGTELTAPDNLKREGYTFNGWDSEVPQTVPASDKTFTAQWTSTVYTITYTLDGGKTETENPTSYTIESKEITLNTPAKEGYTFMGWTGTGLKQATSEVTIPQGSTGNRSYTATWKVIEVNPIEDEAVVDFSTLSDETLQNNVVNDVYYNLDGSAYDSTDESVVIGQSTDMQQINDKSPGSNDICSKFKGLIIKVGTGNGSIRVNTMTSGNAALAIQIGNNTPTIAQKTDKGDVTVGYEATEDTYVYIYSTISNNNTNSIKNLSIASTEDFVKIYNITVIPGTTGINIIRGFDNADIETIYDLNGRKLHAAPTKGGIYIINGKKVVQ